MIHIVNRGLDGKFIYPSGRDLSGCSEGFLLVLAPYADYSAETAAKRITRTQCLDMNEYAADLANVTLKEEEGGIALKGDEQDEESAEQDEECAEQDEECAEQD
jgi:hypothetical protein